MSWRCCSLLLVVVLLSGCAKEGPSLDAGRDDLAVAGLDATGIDASGDSADDAPKLEATCPVVGYQPCGGELEGVWSFDSLCPEDAAAAAALYEHPYDNLAECKDRKLNGVKAEKVDSGTMTFAKGMVSIKTSGYVDLTYDFTDACLAAVKPNASTPTQACTDLANAKLSCVYQAKLCTCKGRVNAPDDDATSSYQLISGRRIQIQKDVASYCRSGDVLIFDWLQHPISWRYWVLRRLK